MKSMIKAFYKTLAIISISVLIFSCNENVGEVGTDILPSEDYVKVHLTDTVSVEAYTYTVDTLVSSQVSSVIVGQYDDPVFGFVQAGFALQFDISSNFTFTDSFILDNITMQLYYTSGDSLYGSPDNEITLEVYELTEYLEYDSAYYSTKNPDQLHENNLLSLKSFYPHTLEDQEIVHFNLDSSLISKFADADEDYFNLSDEDYLFKDLFKGVYVRAVSPTNSLLKFDVDSGAYIKIDYHYPSTPDETESYVITANSSYNARVNLFSHDYTGTEFYGNLNSVDSESEYAYVQGGAGLKTKIILPNLADLENISKKALYRAELVIPAADKSYAGSVIFSEVENLILIGENTPGEYYFLPEYLSGDTYLSESITSDKEYRFDITSYIHSVLYEGVENYDLSLITYGSSTNMRRTVINSGKNQNPMKLILTYSDL